MAAFVEHSFERGFVLDEERVRKIASLVAQRLDPNNAGGKFEYVVYRGDAFSYVTADVADVVAEDNTSWKRITRLDIRSTDVSNVKLKLTCSHAAGVTLEIEGQDRDAVFVLYSDLRSYIEEDVTTAVRMPEVLRPLGLLLFLSFALWIMWRANFVEANRRASPAELVATLRSADIPSKLNFLIRRSEGSRQDLPIWPMTVFLILMFVSASGLPDRLVRYISPRNVFLFGGQRERFERRRHVLSNLWWVVVIGGAVSVITGILVWWLTLRR